MCIHVYTYTYIAFRFKEIFTKFKVIVSQKLMTINGRRQFGD